MTIDTSREAVERLLDDVTPGPWDWAENHPLNACANVTAKAISGWTIDIATLYGCSDGVPNPSAPDEPWGDHPIRRANARFIAASRELVPALLARADAAELELARAMSEIASLDGDCDRWHEKFRTAEAEVRQLKLTNENRRKLFEALLAERDAALAEVARLSTPPDDAEVAALVKRLSGTPLYEGHGEASDAPDEAADALTRLSHAHAAETAKREAMEEALEEISTYDTGGTAGVAYTAKVALADLAARRKE